MLYKWFYKNIIIKRENNFSHPKTNISPISIKFFLYFNCILKLLLRMKIFTQINQDNYFIYKKSISWFSWGWNKNIINRVWYPLQTRLIILICYYYTRFHIPTLYHWMLAMEAWARIINKHRENNSEPNVNCSPKFFKLYKDTEFDY